MATAKKFGSEFLVNSTTADHQYQPSIAALADGRFVVSWADSSASGGDTSGVAVRGQIFDPREAAVTLLGSNKGDDFTGTKFGDTMSGKKGDDNLVGQGGRDVLHGNKGDDTLIGNQGKDMLVGGKGNDALLGNKGADTLKGGAGTDTLKGGPGSDRMIGGKGQDDQTGGAGADRFVFNSMDDTGKVLATRDVITDFSQTQGDVIDPLTPKRAAEIRRSALSARRHFRQPKASFVLNTTMARPSFRGISTATGSRISRFC